MVKVDAVIELHLVSVPSGYRSRETELGVVALLDDDHRLIRETCERAGREVHPSHLHHHALEVLGRYRVVDHNVAHLGLSDLANH